MVRNRTRIILGAAGAVIILAVFVSIFWKSGEKIPEPEKPARSAPAPVTSKQSSDPAIPPESNVPANDAPGDLNTLRGRVLDHKRKPIPGSRVELLWIAEAELFLGAQKEIHHRRETETDEEGSFQFLDLPYGKVSLQVAAEGAFPHSLELVLPAPWPVEIVLPGKATVFGSVLLDTGEPLPETTVKATSGESTFESKTNPDGTYRLEVPSGMFSSLVAYPPNRESRDHAKQRSVFLWHPPSSIRVEAGGELEKNFVFPKGSAIEGIVLEPDGQPSQKATVIVKPLPGTENPEWIQETTGKGNFLFEGLYTGAYVLAAFSERGINLVPDGDLLNAEDRKVQEAGKIVIHSPGMHINTRVQLTAFAEVRGLVLDSQDRPVAGAEVTADTSDGAFSLGRNALPVPADSTGKFQISVVPNRDFQIYAIPTNTSGCSYSPSHFSGLDPGEIKENVILRFSRAVPIRILVTGEEGNPIEGVWIRGTVPQYLFGALHKNICGDVPEHRTGPDGWLRTHGWPEVQYYLRVEAIGYESQEIPLGELEEGEEVERQVTLARPGPKSLRGVVLSGEGTPIDGVEIQLYPQLDDDLLFVSNSRDEIRSTRTNQQGNFWIAGLKDQSYHLHARGGGYLNSGPHEVIPGNESLRIILDRGLELKGQVVLESGEPVSLAEVRADYHSAWTTEKGFFHLRGIQLDAKTFEIREDRIYAETFEIPPQDGEPQVFVMKARPTFQGLVLGPDGEPVTNIVLQGTHRDASNNGGSLYIPVDHKGRFQFRWGEETPPPPRGTLKIDAPYYLKAEDCAPILLEDFALQAEGNVLQFQRGIRVRILVQDPSGKPLRWVRLKDPLQENSHWHTGAKGRAVLGPFLPGKVRIEICEPYTTEDGHQVLIDPALPENVIRVIRRKK